MLRPLLLFLPVYLLVASPSSAQSSELWGHAGEDWDAGGRLPDFSHAGYRGGEAPLPEVPVVADVMDFGALGNGITDDVNAFRAAIASAASQGGGAVYVPAGTYVIADILEIDVDNVVLRGAGSGPGGTELYFTRHLEELTGQKSPWNYGEGGLIWIGDRSGGNNAGLGSRLTAVVSPQLRGDRELVVSNSNGIAVGDTIVLAQTDPGDDSLGLHIHNDQANPGSCSWQPLPLYWPVEVKSVNGPVVELDQPLRLDVRSSWDPEIFRYDPVREVGIESMALVAEAHVYPGHLAENGYNPITFQGAQDCWMKDIAIEYADNGPSFVGLTKNCTAKEVFLLAGFAGHHGFSLRDGATDNLIEDFLIDPVFVHGITVDHNPTGNVVRRGSGKDISLDHHRDGAYENLFTDIDVGFGYVVWDSGGSSCAGPNAGARQTYWNLRSGTWDDPPTPGWIDIQSNLVPAQYPSTSLNNAWQELIDDITPKDLYASQLQARLDDELLVNAQHTVATFQDATVLPLGQEEGSKPLFSNGSLLIPDTNLARFVVPTRTYDDQEILFQVEPGFPRGADIGALIRAADPSLTPSQGTRVVLEGYGGSAQTADYVVLKLLDENGFVAQSSNLYLDPAASILTVRAKVTGTRVQAFVNDVLAFDYTGIDRPAGGGYTSFYADRDASVAGGTLGFLMAEVLVPTDGAEIHVDQDGILWITLHQENLLAGTFDSGAFQFFLGDSLQLDYGEFIALVWPNYIEKIESVSTHHITFGLDFPLDEGTCVGVLYGAFDEAFVPWW